jgi:hypothetical protein
MQPLIAAGAQSDNLRQVANPVSSQQVEEFRGFAIFRS